MVIKKKKIVQQDSRNRCKKKENFNFHDESRTFNAFREQLSRIKVVLLFLPLLGVKTSLKATNLGQLKYYRSFTL